MDLPQKFETFSEARRNGFLKAHEIKEAGGKIAGVFCTFTPLEILDAAGFSPVGLCGMSDETIPAAEIDLPKNLCPLIKSSYGFAVSQKCPYVYYSDLIVGETTCDGKKKMYELLGELKPTYILHLPQGTARGGALDAWTAELRLFREYLEDRFGVRITEEALRAAAAVRNEERRARVQLMELQKLTPPPVQGRNLYQVLEGAGFQFDRREAIDSICRMQREISAEYEAGARPVSAAAKRILVTGCPAGGVLNKTIRLIEEKGGVVACFENCSGMKAAYQMVDTEAPDILHAIAERYLEIGCAVMTPNEKRMELIPRLVQEYAIDGVVEIVLQSCHPYAVESFGVRRLCESLGLPYLGIETDYSKTDSGQQATRIEAFLEMM